MTARRLIATATAVLVVALAAGCATATDEAPGPDAAGSSSAPPGCAGLGGFATAGPLPSGPAVGNLAGALDGLPVYAAVYPVEVVDDHAVLTIVWSRPDTCGERSAVSVGDLLDEDGGLAALRLTVDGQSWAPGTLDDGGVAVSDPSVEVLPSACATTAVLFAAPDADEVDVVVPGLGTVAGVPVVAGGPDARALDLGLVTYPSSPPPG
jgi:hypothetical protein